MAPSPRLLVVVAHPDDETFGTGSLLLHAAAAGVTTAVCCATRGEAGEVAEGSGVDPAGLGAVRERELRRALLILGVERLDLLGFTDSGMSGEPARGALTAVPLGDVVNAVRRVIESFRPHVMVTMDGSDGHRDHVRIRDAALAAAESSEWRVQRIYLHCIVRSLIRRWLEHARSSDPAVGDAYEEIAVGTPDEDVTTVLDVTEHLGRRLEAVAAHASQRSPFEGLPADLRTEFLTHDYLRRIRPPWTGRERETDLFEGVVALG